MACMGEQKIDRYAGDSEIIPVRYLWHIISTSYDRIEKEKKYYLHTCILNIIDPGILGTLYMERLKILAPRTS